MGQLEFAQLLALTKKIIAGSVRPTNPICVHPDGRSQWDTRQIISVDQIIPGMLLIRVVGDIPRFEPVVATSKAFSKNDSWWYEAIKVDEPTKIRRYSLGDAGVVPTVGGWSQNYLFDTSYSIGDIPLLEMIAGAK